MDPNLVAEKWDVCPKCGVKQPARALDDGACIDTDWCSTHGTNAPEAPEPPKKGAKKRK